MPGPRGENTESRSRKAGEVRPPRPVHEAFMRQAVEQARSALHIGEVPIGAVLTLGGAVVAQGFNQPIHTIDPTAHAEIIALRHAAKL